MLIEFGLVSFTTWILGEMIDVKQLFKYGMSEIEFKKRTTSAFSDTKLILGIDENNDIIDVDCSADGHVLICGLSLCGKSRMAENFLKDKKNVVILNAFKKDFTVLKQAKRINGVNEITQFLKTVLNDREEITSDEIKEPLFILIDEILVLSARSKDAIKEIGALLADARHYGVFIIALTQEANKDVIACKNLFNIRICMTMIDDSAFKVVLGAGIKDNFSIPKKREFIVFDNKGLRKGRTIDVVHDDEKEEVKNIGTENTTAAANDVIEAVASEAIEEVEVIEEIKENGPGVQEQALDLNYVNIIKEEIKNKPLAELINEVDNIKEVEKPKPKKTITKKK